jgi:hypothetical protein
MAWPKQNPTIGDSPFRRDKGQPYTFYTYAVWHNLKVGEELEKP